MEDSQPMTKREGDHDHLTTADPHHLRRYLARAAKAYLCVACWFALWAVLVLYGPPAMSVPSDPTHASRAVPAIFSIMLSGSAAGVLTIVLVVGVLAGIGRRRNHSIAEQDEANV